MTHSPIKSAPPAALGIDVGGTKIAAGLVDLASGQVDFARMIPTRPERGGEAVLADVVSLAEALRGESKSQGREFRAIGMGLCELVNSEGRILSQNCVAWQDDQVRRRLAHLGPVVLEADVRAAAQAEAHFGAGHPFRIFLYVTIGTGISSCLMLDGQPYVGARGATGTMASSPISISCDKCGHPNDRTLEQIASGPALVARLNQLHPGAAAQGQEVLAAAQANDSHAREIIRSAGHALGAQVALLVNVLDPEAVIIGGGLGLSDGYFWDFLTHSTRRHIWSEIHRDLPILRAQTGLQAGVIGAALAAMTSVPGSP